MVAWAKPSRRAVGSIALSALLLGVGWVLMRGEAPVLSASSPSQPPSTTPTMIAPHGEDLASVRQAVRGMEKRQARLEQLLSELVAAKSVEANAGVDKAPSVGSETDNQDRVDEFRANDDSRAKMFLQRVDDVFQDEAADTEWSAGAEEVIVSAFRAADYGGTYLDNAECHANMCRVDVSHEGQDERQKFLATFLAARPWNTDVLYRPAADGEGTVVYLAREPGGFPSM